MELGIIKLFIKTITYSIFNFRMNIIAKPQTNLLDTESEEQIVYLGDDKPIVYKQGQRSRVSSESKVKFSRSNSESCK